MVTVQRWSRFELLHCKCRVCIMRDPSKMHCTILLLRTLEFFLQVTRERGDLSSESNVFLLVRHLLLLLDLRPLMDWLTNLGQLSCVCCRQCRRPNWPASLTERRLNCRLRVNGLKQRLNLSSY